MMQGSVNPRREAILRLRLRGLSGIEQGVDFVIDTGFDSTLVVPQRVAEALGFVFAGTHDAILADGRLQSTRMYLGEVEWDGVFQPIYFIGVGDEALIGTEMLNRHELRIEFTPGGMVEISELP